MIGGDLATKYPLRMVAGILKDQSELADWLREREQHFRHGNEEISMILKQIHSTQTMTTSCGRVLDAISAVLGLCYERTYEGEPAMKLESAALGGKDVLKLEPVFNGEVIETTSMVREVFASIGRLSVRDLACSAQSYMARSLGKSAIEVANKLGLKTIGFTGGVACNEAVTRTLKTTVESEGFRFLVHKSVPPGDGGLSFGQAVVAAKTA
jgi:hydrogenase maturation protein HypF